MTEGERVRFEANGWVITARWYYAMGLLVVGLVSKLNNLSDDRFPLSLMFTLFAAAIVINLLLALIYWYLKTAHPGGVNVLSGLQLVAELGLLSVILVIAGGVQSAAPAFFFIPIVESIVLFGAWGPIATALGAGAALNLIQWKNYQSSGELIQAGVLTIVYLIVGIFAAYIAHLLKQQTNLLARHADRRENRLAESEQLNKELQSYAAQLSAKDLEITMANQRLQALEQAKSKFVAVTTHQLRTPLAAIKWTFELLRQGGLGPVTAEQQDFLTKGFQSAKRMIAIVNDLLNIDLSDAARADYHWSDVDLAELIDSIIFEFTNQAESKKIELVFNRPANHLPTIQADPVKLRIVLENLIDNAIKYTKRHGRVMIMINSERLNSAQNSLEVIIKDSGVGIPVAEQSKIFHKFFRASNAILAEPDGSGLGLFIAKDIVDKHQGSIWFDSHPDTGTTFHLLLPRYQPTV